MMTELHLPTERIVLEYLELFRSDAVLKETEDALWTLFQQFPTNERGTRSATQSHHPQHSLQRRSPVHRTSSGRSAHLSHSNRRTITPR